MVQATAEMPKNNRWQRKSALMNKLLERKDEEIQRLKRKACEECRSKEARIKQLESDLKDAKRRRQDCNKYEEMNEGLRQLKKKDEEIQNEVAKVCEPLILSETTIRKIVDLLRKELERGLSKKTNSEAKVKCFPTYVTDLPNGKEQGKFLALDLGGTNFRVLLIELKGNHKDESPKSKIFAVPQDVMLGSGQGLFDHIAECLATFMKDFGVESEKLPLGFTFSFPCSQEGLTKARLVTWTKGFKCSGVEGEDVVHLLQEAIKRRGDITIDVCGVLNDTTGTLLSSAWFNRKCRIGLIVGTGTNACYLETIDNVELVNKNELLTSPKKMIVNTEWGAFGDDGCLSFIQTKYDKEIDDKSLNPGRQLFEKMISGMYMGELARLVMVQLINQGSLLRNKPCEQLMKPDKFYTKYISEIEMDNKGEYHNCREVLEELGIVDVSDQDCQNIRYICEVVSKRAAQLAGAGVACLLLKMNEKDVAVAVDGSVYRFHPHFHNLMTSTIHKLVPSDFHFDLMLSDDGSGRGAALVAAVASREK